jgi:hypothetical protein
MLLVEEMSELLFRRWGPPACFVNRPCAGEPARKILSEAAVFCDFQEGTGSGKDRAVEHPEDRSANHFQWAPQRRREQTHATP